MRRIFLLSSNYPNNNGSDNDNTQMLNAGMTRGTDKDNTGHLPDFQHNACFVALDRTSPKVKRIL